MRKPFLHNIIVAAFIAAALLQPAYAVQTSRSASTDNDMLAAASVENGHELSHNCTFCHTLDKGGPDRTGPNLFGIVGAKVGREKGYAYSDAVKNMKNRTWTLDNLDTWLKDPGLYAPGTKMAFMGYLDPQDRWDLIAFLRTLK